MKKEIESVIAAFDNTLNGHPWFGRAVYEILEEVDPSLVNIKPNNTEHSLCELLWHMITWAEFTLKRIEGDKETDLAASEKLDWRKLDPKKHSWKKGITEFKAINKKIIQLVKKKDEKWLNEKVDYRKYNFRFLLEGVMQHNIYHLGQIAYLNKLFSSQD